MLTGREVVLLLVRAILTRSMSPVPVPKNRSENLAGAGGGPGGLMTPVAGGPPLSHPATSEHTNRAASGRRICGRYQRGGAGWIRPRVTVIRQPQARLIPNAGEASPQERYALANAIYSHLRSGVVWRLLDSTMYVCICAGVNDRQIRQAVCEGASSLADLTACLGVGAGCGACREMAQQFLSEPAAARAAPIPARALHPLAMPG
jgi:bacterioferritin-associated ferredoxin